MTGSVSRDPSAAQTRTLSLDGCDHRMAAIEKFDITSDYRQALCSEEGRKRSSLQCAWALSLKNILTGATFSEASVLMHRTTSGKASFGWKKLVGNSLSAPQIAYPGVVSEDRLGTNAVEKSSH